MTKLTQVQHALLRSAADSQDGVVETPTTRSGKTTVTRLIKAGLILGMPFEGGGLRLLITDAGRGAVAPAPRGIALKAPNLVAAALQQDSKIASGVDLRGKLGSVVHLLRREEGATIAELMALTGWQAHSVRGAISGTIKKKLQLAVISEVVDEVRRYRVQQDPA